MKTNLWLTVLTVALVLNAVMMRNTVDGDECTSGIRKEHLDPTPGHFVDGQTIQIGSNGLQVSSVFGKKTTKDTANNILGVTGVAAGTAIYRAECDGFLSLFNYSDGTASKVYVDQSPNPNTLAAVLKDGYGFRTGDEPVFAVIAVGKNEYVKLGKGTTTATGLLADWQPVGSGGLVKNPTMLLLHFDGVDGATSTSDANGHSIAFNSNAQLDTAHKQFGTAALFLDGAGDYVSIPASADWNWGTENWTIDFWIRPASINNNKGIFDNCFEADYLRFSCFTNNSDNNIIGVRFGGTSYGGSVDLEIDQWYHVAIVRNGTSLRSFINGTKDIDVTIAAEASWDGSTRAFWIGAYYHNNINFNGWIDEFRISKGIACWTENFAVSTEAYSVQ